MQRSIYCGLRPLASFNYPLVSFIVRTGRIVGLYACITVCSAAWAQAPPNSFLVGPNVSVDSRTANDTPLNSATAPQSGETQQSLPDTPSVTQKKSSVPTRLTFADRSRIYGHALLRPYTVVGPAFGAGIGQWEDEPPEWGQGGQGYGRRLASGVGRSIISESIRFGVAAVDKEDPRYRRSNETGVWNRTRYVIVATFTSQTESGNRIPAYSRFAGVYGAAFISNAWYPESRATPGYALRRGSSALASSLGLHLFEEFVPRKYFEALHIPD